MGLYTGSEAQLDLATVRYHALGAYAKSVYLVLSSRYRTAKVHIKIVIVIVSLIVIVIVIIIVANQVHQHQVSQRNYCFC